MYAVVHVRGPHNAWNWYVAFRRRNKRYWKRFFDRKLGGKKKVLSNANAWRDRTLARVDAFTRRELCQRKRSNNTSGLSTSPATGSRLAGFSQAKECVRLTRMRARV